MKKTKILLKKYWPILVIFLLGLISLSWFQKDYLVAGGDNMVYLNPSFNIKNYSFAWYDRIDSGMPSLEVPKIFPFSFFWLAGQKIGFSVILLQKFWTVLHFTLGGIFMYLLLIYLFKELKNSAKIGALLGSVLYMFNYLVTVDSFQPVVRPIVAFLPLAFYWFVKGLDQPRFSLRYPSLFALTTLLYGSSNLNIANVFPIYLIFLVYLLYFLFTTKRFRYGFIFALSCLLLFFIINLWWEINFYFSVIKASGAIVGVVKSFDFLKSTPINEAFRTMGFWAFLQEFNGKTLLPFAMSYYRFPLLFLTFSVPVFAFSSLLFKKNINKKIFFAVLALLGIFLAKGVNFPFGFFYQFLYDKIPGFAVFREPFAKFTLISVFSLSVLIGFFSFDFFEFLKRKENFVALKIAFPFILGILILINAYPLLSGANVQNETWYNDTRSSLHVKIPQHWPEAGEWFKENNSTSRVMLFPKSYYGQTYFWEMGISAGDPVAMFFLKNPLIRAPSSISNQQNILSQIAYQLLFLGKQVDLAPYFDLFAVDLVLQQNEVTPNNENGIFDPLIMKEILSNQKSLKFEKSFGNLSLQTDKEGTVSNISALDVYSVLRNYPSRQIYLPTSLIYIDGKAGSFPDIFSFFSFKPDFGYFFSQDQPEKQVDIENNAALVLINLKEKLSSENEQEFDYTFNIPKKSEFMLLVNEYLFESEQKPFSEYYLSLNQKTLNIPQEKTGGWRMIDLGELDSGNQSLKTNLSVSKITTNHLTSPFWLAEKQIRQNQDKVSSGVSFEKKNPSKYLVSLKKPTDMQLLVLSETFNNQWKIYFKNQQIRASHFLINGFANGWYLKPEDFITNEEEIELELIYQPQKIGDIGSKIAVFVILGVSLYLLIDFVKEKRKEKKNV